MKAIFLDRDGVINKKMPEHDHVKSWNEFSFLPDSKEALKNLAGLDYVIIIITNQRAIKEGTLTINGLALIHKKMKTEIKEAGGRIDAVYYCPHGYNECECRKPGSELFLKAQEKFNLNFNGSWMIGDSKTDIEAGQRLGLKTIFLKKDYNQIPVPTPDYILNNLSEVAELIKQDGQK